MRKCLRVCDRCGAEFDEKSKGWNIVSYPIEGPDRVWISESKSFDLCPECFDSFGHFIRGKVIQSLRKSH